MTSFMTDFVSKYQQDQDATAGDLKQMAVAFAGNSLAIQYVFRREAEVLPMVYMRRNR